MGFAAHANTIRQEDEGLTPMGIDFVIFYVRYNLADAAMELLSFLVRAILFFQVCGCNTYSVGLQ